MLDNLRLAQGKLVAVVQHVLKDLREESGMVRYVRMREHMSEGVSGNEYRPEKRR